MSLFLTGTGPGRVDHVNLVLGLSGLLLVLCAVIGTFYGLRRWWQRQQQEESSRPDDLANFHALYEEGELSQEELERVRQVVEKRPASAVEPLASPEAEKDPES